MEKLDKVYSIFVEWKAKPLKATDPQNVDEFCELHEVTKSDLADFTKRPEYHDNLTTAALNWARGKVPELLHVAFEEARLSKDVASIERFINIAHELKKKKDQGIGGNQFNFFNIDNDKLKQIAARTIGNPLVLAGSSTSETP